MKRQVVWISSLAMAASLMAGSFATAQEVKRETTRTEVQTEAGTRTTEVRRVTTVVGGTVQFSDGGTLGKIEDIIISDGGCIDYVVVKYEDEFVPIPWRVATVNYADRIIRLDMTRTAFRDVPTFARGDFRVFSDAGFTRRVNTFFDVDVDVNTRTNRRDVDRRGRDVDVDVDRRDRDGNRNDRDADRRDRDGNRSDRDADRRDRDGNRSDRDADRDADRRDPATNREDDRKPSPTPRDREPAAKDKDREPAPKDKAGERPAPGTAKDRPLPPAPRDRDVKPAPKEVKPKEVTPGNRPPKPPVPNKPEAPAPK